MEESIWAWEEEGREEWAGREESARGLRRQGNGFDGESSLRALKMKRIDVLAVFLLGSRLWGNAKESSDFDLLIVTRNHWKKSGKSAEALHSQCIDAIVMTEEELKARIDRMRLPEIIVTQLPDECHWYTTPTFASLQSQMSPTLDRETLVRSLRLQCDKDWKRAEKLRMRKDLAHAQKILLHSIRYALLSRQLLKHGNVECWTCAQPYVESFQCDYDSSDFHWNALRMSMDKLLASVTDLV